MLYDILIIILAIIIPVAAIIAFKAGYNIGRAIRHDEPAKQAPLFMPKSPQRRETDEERKQRILLENIENYGTKKPQREVK